MSNKENEIYEFGDFRLDVRERTLEHRSGGSVGYLPEKAFRTLAFLVSKAGTLVSKEELLDHVWSDAVVEENNLDKAIHAIRHALGEKRGGMKYIETVRKHGYRFVAPVKGAEPATTTLGSVETLSTPTDVKRLTARPSMRRAFALSAGTALLALMGVAVWFGSAGSGPISMAPEGRTAESASPGYDFYIRGKVKVASESREETTEAIALLEQAVAADPNLARAHAALARGYNTMAFKYSTGAERKRWHENAEVAIEKALALDPDLAEAHFARGLILWSNTEGFPHERAIQSYKRSLALDEANDETHHQLSFVYSHVGLMEEARREIERALEINPNNTLARYRVGVYAQYQGRFEEALAVHKTIPRDFTPLLVDRTTAELLIQTGRVEEAERVVEAYLERYPQDEGGSFTSVKALLSAKAGNRAEAEEMIRRAEEIGSDFGHYHHTAYNIACAHAALGGADDAVRWLERAADGGFPNYPYFEIDPNLDPLRQHPGFIEFMAKLKPRLQLYKSVQ